MKEVQISITEKQGVSMIKGIYYSAIKLLCSYSDYSKLIHTLILCAKAMMDIGKLLPISKELKSQITLAGSLIDFALFLSELYENPNESKLKQLPTRIVKLLVARYTLGIGASYKLRVMNYL